MPTTTAIDKQLIDLEKKYWDAMKTGDMNTMSALTADPCLVVGADGARKVNKKELGQMMQSEGYRLRSYRVDEANVNVRQLSDDMAVIAYKVHEESNRNGKDQSLDAYDSSVWIRKGDRWECAVHTETMARA